MFNKLKQFNDLRKQANSLKNALAEEIIEVNNSAVKIVMDGNQSIKTLEISPDYMSADKKKDLEKKIIDGIADAIKKVQKKMASKMQDMGGFDFPGMK